MNNPITENNFYGPVADLTFFFNNCKGIDLMDIINLMKNIDIKKIIYILSQRNNEKTLAEENKQREDRNNDLGIGM